MKHAHAIVLGLVMAFAIRAPSHADPDSSSSSLIVFSSNRSGSWKLWTVCPDGSGLKQLLKGTDPAAQDVDPAFSPDGKTILFTSTRGGTGGIWIVSDDGQKLEQVCDGDQAEWAPDGARIAFRKDHTIWTRDLKSGAETQVVPDAFKTCSGPSWSPDGNQIAFACRWDGGNGLFLVAAEGGKPIKVYDKKGACEPHWSPDGATLVYETETHICTIKPDGTKNRLITYYGGVQRYGQWGPEGKQLVFCQGVSEKGPWELYVVPSGGGTPTKLTDEGSDMNPDWR